jgi:hypothetical protein
MSVPDGAPCASNEDSSLRTAQWWTERGFFVVPIPIGTKAPVKNAWQDLRLTADQLPEHFSTPVNVGILTGTVVPGGGFVCDVDFDCTEAIAAWSEFAPAPTWEFGRASKPRSHAFYLIDSAVASMRFVDPVAAERARQTTKKKALARAKQNAKSRDHDDAGHPDVNALADEGHAGDPGAAPDEGEVADKSTLLELRCLKKDGTVGLQTVGPGSLHPSGEIIRWEPNRRPGPTPLKTDDLARAVESTAAAALLARHFPAKGCRNEALLAIAGGLARVGWSEENAAALVRAIYRILWPDNPDFRAAEAEVRASYAKFAAGGEVTGFRRLKELGIPRTALVRAAEWLHLPFGSGTSRTGTSTVPGGHPYFERDGEIWRHAFVHGESVDVPIATFTARITETIAETNGMEERLAFRLQASAGSVERTFDLTPAQFMKPEWPLERLGPAAVVHPKEWERVRTAIQLLSPSTLHRTVYCNTGWIQVAGEGNQNQDIYLYGSGGIGPNGVVPLIETRLPQAMARYELFRPRDSAECREAIRASLRMLEMAPKRITYPIFGFVYRASLGPSAFVVFLNGRTGRFKSGLASVAQQHFGPRMGWDSFGYRLPLSFQVTANAAEIVAFAAKDTLLVVDDFAPGADPREAARIQDLAARLIRGVADRAGRVRLSRDIVVQAAHPPRGSLLMTGEDLPKGESNVARLLVIDVEPDDVKLTALSESQQDGNDGRLATSMGAFIHWLAGGLRGRKEAFAARVRDLRSHMTGLHARTPGAISELQGAVELFLDFAVELGAIDESEHWQYRLDSAEAFRALAHCQRRGQFDNKPELRFQNLVRTLIATGRAHLRTLDGGQPTPAMRARLGWRPSATYPDKWLPGGNAIGWSDGTAIYLEFGAAFAEAQKLAAEMREPLVISELSLKKCLCHAGLIADKEDNRGRLTVRLPGDPTRTPVVHVVDQFLDGPDEEPPSSFSDNQSSNDAYEEVEL